MDTLSISMDEFEQIHGKWDNSVIGKAVRNMEVGRAIRLPHPSPCKGKLLCNLTRIVSYQNKIQDTRFYRTSHDKNGDFLVACYAKKPS